MQSVALVLIIKNERTRKKRAPRNKKNTKTGRLTLTKNLKLQRSPGLVAYYDIQPGNGLGLFWDATHTHIFPPRSEVKILTVPICTNVSIL